MSDIESAEDFADRIDGVLTNEDTQRACEKERADLVRLVSARDAAIRLDERRKVLREAAEWCEAQAKSERMRLLGDSRRLVEARDHFRSLADKEPER